MSLASPLDSVVITGVARTPMGSFQGGLASLTAPQLGAVAIRAAVRRAGIAPAAVQEVLMGCVLSAGVGQAPTRQAAISADLPLSAGCTTIGKVCGSGMKAIMLAHDLLLAGSQQVVVAGGMESMTNAPYLLPNARSGQRLGHGQMIDHMFFDGLEDAYSVENRGRLMGTFAEDCAVSHELSRSEQDAFAVLSTRRSQEASRDGGFDWEIEPITLSGRHGDALVGQDEGPFAVDIEKIPTLKAAFRKNGSVTAANSSSISDGAAAVVLMRSSQAELQGIKPLARIIGHANHAGLPALFPTAPVGSVQKLLNQIGWDKDTVDLYEFNEAFAIVPMIASRELNVSLDKINVHGGACALGHPIGASGARIVVTLLGALRRRGLRRGVASLCIGGGEATALAVELM